MALLTAIVICVFVLLFALTIPICGLLPAIRMGPIKGKGERRLWIAWWVAVTLNIAVAVVPLYGRLGFLLCPSIAFGLAASVGGSQGETLGCTARYRVSGSSCRNCSSGVDRGRQMNSTEGGSPSSPR